MPEEEVHGKKFAAVRIRSIRWLHDCQPFGLLEDGGPPPVNLVEFGALAVVILAVGVPEEDVVGNQKLECIKRDVREPEDDMFEKKDAAGYNLSYGWSEEDVVGKQDGSVR